MKTYKIITALSLATIASIGLSTTSLAEPSVQETNNIYQQTSNDFIQPYFKILIDVSCHLLSNGNKLTCKADASVQYGYTAKITMELQQYNGGWNTIKTWTDSGDEFAILDKDWYVDSGYTYRLKVKHQGLNQNGTILDTFTDYSEDVFVD